MSDAAPANPAAADRNLLFGILAVQMDFVGRDALVAAMNAWVLAKHRPLGELLQEQGALAPERRVLLDAMVTEHLKAHGGDAQRSLAAVAQRSTLGDLAQSVADPDLHASLAAAGATLATTADCRPSEDGLRYRVVRPHAQGGLGVVSVARDAELGREVALKEIQTRYAEDATLRGRFVREAEITGGLEHPGVVPVYGLGRYADGRPYYAMRFVRGETLQDAGKKLHAGEPGYTLRSLLTRFVAVCNAVAYAHSRGVLHRDLKPANVMLGPYGETLVVDWGLAKVIGRGTADGEGTGEPTLRPASGEGSQTQAGAALGTPAFMSPEQARGEVAGLSPATDVYSLGATLYATLTGRPPVRGRDTPEVLEKVREGNWPAPRQVKSSVPKALDAVCRKAMALKPTDRYGSAQELATDIERWLADEPVTAWREPWPTRFGRWRRRHRALVASAAAAAVVALLLGGGGLLRQQRDLALRRQEQDRRRAAAEAALEQVGKLQAQARWDEARATLEQAEAHLAGVGAGQTSHRLEAVRRNLQLVARLDSLRSERASSAERQWLGVPEWDFCYEAEFRKAGLGGPGDDPGRASKELSRSEVREALVAALDDWALVARGERRAWALDVARRADPHPWRDRLRDATAWEDEKALSRLAQEAPAREVTPSLAAAVGGRLSAAQAGEGLLRAAQAVDPGDFWLNYYLADALARHSRPGEAEGFARAAVAVRPASLAAREILIAVLRGQGKKQEAAMHGRKLLELHPGIYSPRLQAQNLIRAGKLPEGEALLRKALDRTPGDPDALLGLGELLAGQGKAGEAEAYLREVLEVDPKNADATVVLGYVLSNQRKFAESAALYRKAIELDPRNGTARCGLTRALLALGKYPPAAEAARTSLAVLPAADPDRVFLERFIRLADLGPRLPALLRGEDRPASPAEGLDFALLCYYREFYAESARLFASVFAAEPRLADDLRAGYRYYAARSAALAGCGKGDGAPADGAGRARWRRQACEWLWADLALRGRQLHAGPFGTYAAFVMPFHWPCSAELSGVREPAGLAKLPEAERKEWEALWAEVKALLEKLSGG